MEPMQLLDALAIQAFRKDSEERRGDLMSARIHLQPPVANTHFLSSMLAESDLDKLSFFIRQSDLVRRHTDLFRLYSDGGSPSLVKKDVKLFDQPPPPHHHHLNHPHHQHSTMLPGVVGGNTLIINPRENQNRQLYNLLQNKIDRPASLSDSLCFEQQSSAGAKNSSRPESGIYSIEAQPLDLRMGGTGTGDSNTNASSSSPGSSDEINTIQSLCDSNVPIILPNGLCLNVPKTSMNTTTTGGGGGGQGGGGGGDVTESHYLIFDWLLQARQLIHYPESLAISNCLKDIDANSRLLLFNESWPFILPFYVAEFPEVGVFEGFFYCLPPLMQQMKAVQRLKNIVKQIQSARLSHTEHDVLRLAIAAVACHHQHSPHRDFTKFLIDTNPCLQRNSSLLQAVYDLILMDRGTLRKVFCNKIEALVEAFLESCNANSPMKCINATSQ